MGEGGGGLTGRDSYGHGLQVMGKEEKKTKHTGTRIATRTHRETGTHRDTQRDPQTPSETDRQTDIPTGTDRQTDR